MLVNKAETGKSVIKGFIQKLNSRKSCGTYNEFWSAVTFRICHEIHMGIHSNVSQPVDVA